VRIYLPPDANCLLSVADHCLRSRNYINLIVAGKAAGMAVARHRFSHAPLHRRRRHLAMGQQRCGDPDVVMACAGDVPTLETMAAVTLLRQYVPDIRIRVVNVVDLMVLQPQSEHPARPGGSGFRRAVHTDKPVIFAFHGYPAMIHKLTYRRHNHDNIHVRGYRTKAPPRRRSTWSC
jgi:xylulose-5-phosphate/fructose-6-phosphate phosphoketolase